MKEVTNIKQLYNTDVPFKPKRVWVTRGVVVKRSKAKFKTAFAGDLVDEG